MLRTRATGLLSGRQMTASPFSSAPVAMTSCSDEPLRLRFRLRIIPAQWLIQYGCCQSVSCHTAEGLIRAQFGRIRPLIRDFGNDSIDSRNRRSYCLSSPFSATLRLARPELAAGPTRPESLPRSSS